jgi:hypothetical protein
MEMALSNLRPTIEKTKDGKGWVIRVTRDDRERLWYSLSNDNRINRDGKGYGYTELVVAPYPGYDLYTAFAIALGYTYGILSHHEPDWDLAVFWARTLTEHRQHMNRLVELPHDQPIIDLEDVLLTWIPRVTISDLETVTQDHEFPTGVVYDWWQNGVRAYERLLFAPAGLAMDEPTRQNLLAKAEKSVQLLEQSYKDCKSVNGQIKRAQKDAESVIQRFKTAANQPGATLAGLYEIWRGCREELTRIEARMVELQNSWDQEPAVKALHDLAMITPPEPPKKA